MAPHSSTLAWKIPWMEKSSGLQSMGSLRVRHDWATSLSLFTFMHWRRKWQPTPVFLPGESQGWRSLVGCCRLWGRTESDTTERLSSSSSRDTIGEGNGTPLQYSCLENPMDGGAWWAAVHGVTKSRTGLNDFSFTFTFMHWRRERQPTPVFLPGESQGRGSLMDWRLWGCTESDTTEAT